MGLFGVWPHNFLIRKVHSASASARDSRRDFERKSDEREKLRRSRIKVVLLNQQF